MKTLSFPIILLIAFLSLLTTSCGDLYNDFSSTHTIEKNHFEGEIYSLSDGSLWITGSTEQTQSWQPDDEIKVRFGLAGYELHNLTRNDKAAVDHLSPEAYEGATEPHQVSQVSTGGEVVMLQNGSVWLTEATMQSRTVVRSWIQGDTIEVRNNPEGTTQHSLYHTERERYAAVQYVGQKATE